MHQVPSNSTPPPETFHFAEGLMITVSDDESLIDCNYWRTNLISRDEPFLWVGYLKAHLFLPREIANGIVRMNGTTFRLSKADDAGNRELYSDRAHRFALKKHQHAGEELDSMFRILETYRRNSEGEREQLAIGILKKS